MSTYDDYLTHDDKPYAENINDALLLSNVFDLTVPIELPTMFKLGIFNSSLSPRKAGVAIVTLVSATDLTINDDNIKNNESTSKELIFKFYPNFNSYGSITNLSWTASGTGVTANIVGADGTPIKTGHTGGAITGADAKIYDLQEFTITINIPSGVTITKINFIMENKDETRYGAECGITDVDGLTDALAGKSDEGHGHVINDVTNLQNSLDTKVDKVSGKALSANDFTTELKNKLDSIESQATKTVIDSSLSSSSTNPVQNKVVKSGLDGKANSSHTHGNINNNGAIGSTSGKPVITGTNGVLQAGSFGTDAGTFCQGNDSRLSNARTPTSHTHPISEVTNLQSTLNGKASSSHTHTKSQITNLNSTDLFKDLSNNLSAKLTGHAYLTVRNGWAFVDFSVSVKSGQTITDGVTLFAGIPSTAWPRNFIYAPAVVNSGTTASLGWIYVDYVDTGEVHYNGASVSAGKQIRGFITYPVKPV